MEIQLWYRRGADFHAECFMWCTAGGGLPDTPEQQIDIDTGESVGPRFTMSVRSRINNMLKLYVLFTVISDESRLEKISLVANPETEAISTNVIYEFEVGPEGNGTLADDASSFYRFRRLGM